MPSSDMPRTGSEWLFAETQIVSDFEAVHKSFLQLDEPANLLPHSCEC